MRHLSIAFGLRVLGSPDVRADQLAGADIESTGRVLPAADGVADRAGLG